MKEDIARLIDGSVWLFGGHCVRFLLDSSVRSGFARIGRRWQSLAFSFLHRDALFASRLARVSLAIT